MPAEVSARPRRFERRCTKWWDPGRGPKARTRLWTAQTWDREICKVPLRARAPAGRRIPKRLETAMPPGPSCDWLGGMSGLRPRAPPASCGSWAHARHAAKQHAGASREEHSESVAVARAGNIPHFTTRWAGPVSRSDWARKRVRPLIPRSHYTASVESTRNNRKNNRTGAHGACTLQLRLAIRQAVRPHWQMRRRESNRPESGREVGKSSTASGTS